MLKMTLMAGPVGALSVGLVASTTEVEKDINGGTPGGVLSTGPTASTTNVEDDVDGGPPGVHCQWVRQCPPSRLKKTLMTSPLVGAAGGSNGIHHRG
jgi:hypothetical protein